MKGDRLRVHADSAEAAVNFHGIVTTVWSATDPYGLATLRTGEISLSITCDEFYER